MAEERHFGSAQAREVFGYVAGLALFILAIPAAMWFLSGRPFPNPGAGAARTLLAVVLAAVGIALSIWSIVHMKLVGKGNPFDPLGHQVASRTSSLLTTGPYALCRNPMAAGVHIYYLGLAIALAAPGQLALWGVVAVAHTFQIRSEQARLIRDFGAEYEAYRAAVPAILPLGPLLRKRAS